MKRLESLKEISNYLEQFCIGDISPVITTEQSDATSYLSSARGTQVLFARPELQQRGNADQFSKNISTVIFVLEKGLGPENTYFKQCEQYSRLLDLSSNILDKIASDTTNSGCDVLRLSLASVEIRPEASIFGGWLGYSITLDFE